MKNLKNMVVLRDLPSNIIDEAFFILKPNSKVKNLKYSQKKQTAGESLNMSGEYIVKEAEILIDDYLESIKDKDKNKLKSLQEKYKRLRVAVVVLSSLLVFNIATILF